MAVIGKSPFDDASGLSTNLRVSRGVPDIGTADNPIGTLYAENVVNEGGGETLANNVYLKSENAAGTGTLDLVKADASDNTVINAKTGKVGKFAINDSSVGSYSATTITYPKYSLTDGSDKNYNVAATAVGTAYQLTNTSAALVFGTTSPNLTINKAGTYLLLARANLKYNAATFAATRAVTIKLRRTNNTPADLTGGSKTLATAVITTLTYTFDDSLLPPIIYTTAVATDVISIFGDVAVVPTAGSLDVIEASIVAIRLY